MEYSAEGGPVRIAPPTDATPGEHRVLVLGHPAATAVALRPVVIRDGRRVEGREVTVETGLLPAGIHDLEVSVSEAGQSGEAFWMGMLLRSAEIGYAGTPIIIDRAGRVVWYRQLDADTSALQLERTLDASDVLINKLVMDPHTTEQPQSMARIAMDGEILDERSTPGAHHAFAQPEPGVIAYLEEDSRVIDGVTIIGDRIMELDESGDLTELFTTWGSLHIDLDAAISGGEAVDWTHGNGLFYWSEHDSYLVSFHNISTVVEVSRATGEPLAVIGASEGADFVIPGEQETAFQQQHHPTITPTGTLMLFDNHTLEPGSSRAVEYALDYGKRTATLIWEDGLESDYTVAGLGQSHRLESGGTLINWGVLGELSEVSAAGELVWQVNTPLGETFGGGQLIADLYEGL